MLRTHSAELKQHVDRVTTALTLTLVACGCACCVCGWAYFRDGFLGIQQGLIACATCWITSVLAIEFGRLHRHAQSVYGLAFTGILVRMALPLALCGASAWCVGIRQAQCLAICFLLIYPVFLITDTYFVVRMLGDTES